MGTKNKRMDVKVVGTVIGTASGWDDGDVDLLMFYDFQPSEWLTKRMPVFEKEYSIISVNYTTGIIEFYLTPTDEKYTCTFHLTLQ